MGGTSKKEMKVSRGGHVSMGPGEVARKVSTVATSHMNTGSGVALLLGSTAHP